MKKKLYYLFLGIAIVSFSRLITTISYAETYNKLQNNSTQLIQPSPVKPDAIFDGWYTDASLTEPYDFNSPVSSPLTLYAKWNKNEIRSSTKKLAKTDKLNSLSLSMLGRIILFTVSYILNK